jgi:TonB family protein
VRNVILKSVTLALSTSTPTLLLAGVQSNVATASASVAEAELERAPPLEATSLGHHGTVILTGDVTAEGRIAAVSVSKSSRSVILDQFAIKTYGNAKLGADLLASRPAKVRLTINFENFDFDHMGIGYLCKQAMIDNEWWVTAFSDRPDEKNRFHLFVQGLALIDKRMLFAQDKGRFAKALAVASETCRKNPDASYLGAIARAGSG